MTDVAAFIDGLPKAELHLHIEGTLEPELMFALAARNGLEPPAASVAELRAAYRFANLQDFLDLYYRGAGVLLGEADFYDLGLAYFERAAAEGVLHAEVSFDPQVHTRRGVAFETVIDGLHRAALEAADRFGVSSKLILCFLRDLEAGDAMATLEEALRHGKRIAAVGLDSTELGHPPSKFEAVFARVLSPFVIDQPLQGRAG